MNKTCAQCTQKFDITTKDQAFYKQVDVPEPTLCPDCRSQRRWAFRNERVIYPAKCDKCGKALISIYGPGHKQPAWCYECWWGDDWSPLDYGRDIDWNRSILEQVHELILTVPQLSTSTTENEDCDFVGNTAWSKRCYMVFMCYYSEDCMYSYSTMRGRNVVDSHRTEDCELCYWNIYCRHNYNVTFSDHSRDCTDCAFLSHCFNCQDCFGCVNLRNKKYCIWNKQYTKKEYEKEMEKYDLKSYQNLQKIRKQFEEFKKQFTYPATHNENCGNVTGDYLRNCRDCFYCFDMTDCENVKYGANFWKMKDSMDNIAAETELGYENISGTPKYRTLGCNLCIGSSNVSYSKDVMNSNYCFGSVALKKAQYCILNKQYTQEEYEKLMPKITKKMKQDKEWGEFFPIPMSHFAYNESMANVYHPLTQAEAKKHGWRWQEEIQGIRGKETKSLEAMPDSITDTDESITKDIFACAHCGRNFKIVTQELDFHKRLGLPLPHQCVQCRIDERQATVNPRRMRKFTCGSCGEEHQTTYPENTPYKIVCESCYRKEVV